MCKRGIYILSLCGCISSETYVFVVGRIEQLLEWRSASANRRGESAKRRDEQAKRRGE